MTKQVALADRTYTRLKGSRRPGESFSAAIERLLAQVAKDPSTFLDTPRSRADPDAWIARIEADRDDATVEA